MVSGGTVGGRLRWDALRGYQFSADSTHRRSLEPAERRWLAEAEKSRLSSGHDRRTRIASSFNRFAFIPNRLAIFQNWAVEFRRSIRFVGVRPAGSSHGIPLVNGRSTFGRRRLERGYAGTLHALYDFCRISRRRSAGAIIATLFVFLPSFVFVLGGAHYVEKVRDNKTIQAFLSGVSAAVVGVIAVVSLDLIPEALVGWPAVIISITSFLLILWLKRDVALVAISAMAGGIVYATVRAFF